MSLQTYLQIVRRRWPVLLATLLVFGCLGVALTRLLPTRYQSTAQLFVSTVLPKDPGALAASNTFTTARVQSYASVATTPRVTEFVVSQLGLTISPGALSHEISADAPLNRVLVNIRVTDASADQAARIANAVAARFKFVVESLEQTQGGKASPVMLTIIKPAAAPVSPVQPRPKLNLALALLAGLLVGVGLMSAWDRYDDKVKSIADLETATDLPVLGVVPRRSNSALMLGSLRPTPARLVKDAFDVLAARLRYFELDSPMRLVGVAGSDPRAGAALVTAGLGEALARSGDLICLVEADLRQPMLASEMRVEAVGGLTSLVLGIGSARDAVMRASDNLDVVPSGPLPPNPESFLASPRTHGVLRGLVDGHDRTLVDLGGGWGACADKTKDVETSRSFSGTPVLVADVLLVARARHTTRRELRRTLAALRIRGIEPFAAALTGVSSRRAGRVFRQTRELTIADSGVSGQQVLGGPIPKQSGTRRPSRGSHQRLHPTPQPRGSLSQQ